MESVSKARLLSFFGSESFYGFEIEVVVEVKIVEIFLVDHEIKHVITLPTNLETSLNPVKLSELEEFCLLESLKKRTLVETLRLSLPEGVEQPAL